MSDRILVTGAAGMLGSHVADLLESRGRDVYRATRARCDLRVQSDTLGLFERVKPTHVIHTAACVYGIMGNMRNQGRSFYDNTVINTNVIEAARLAGVKKVTAIGTGAVYPSWSMNPVYLPQDIFLGRPHPSEAGYAHAKLGMLAMLEAYQESYEMDFAFVVSCNLFGPRDKFDPETGHVVPSLIRKFYEAQRDGTPVTIWGNGTAERDFLYVKDAARAVTLIADGYSGPINMGSGSVLTIKGIVCTLADISGLPSSRVLWDNTKPNGQAHRAYDLAPLADLGFGQQHTIAAGLQETWEWYCHEQAKLAP